jgi:hypothetical protein
MSQMKTQCKGKSMQILALASSVAMLLLFPRAGFAQQVQGTREADVSNIEAVPLSSLMPGAASARPAARHNSEEEEESPKAHKKGSEGVKVHGHWLLQVKNADGTLGERREFENSLVTDEDTTSGDQMLAGLLGGDITPGDPGIAFVSYGSSATPYPSEYCPALCYFLTTPQSPLTNFFRIPANKISTGLVVTTHFSAPVGWVLSGNFTVPAGLTSISAVQTIATYCTPVPAGSGYAGYNNSTGTNALAGTVYDRIADIGPAQCNATNSNVTSTGGTSESSWFAALTSTALTNSGVATPLTVTPGQIITVTVTISFS